jgi:hypothetical protein
MRPVGWFVHRLQAQIGSQSAAWATGTPKPVYSEQSFLICDWV